LRIGQEISFEASRWRGHQVFIPKWFSMQHGFAQCACMDVSHFNGRNTIFTLLAARWSTGLDHLLQILKWFCGENAFLGLTFSFEKQTFLLCLMFLCYAGNVV